MPPVPEGHGLHIPTLLLALSLGGAILWVELVVVRRRLADTAGLRSWIFALGCAGASSLMLAFRQWLPEPLTPVLSNALAVLATASVAQALHRFVRGRSPAPFWRVGLVLLLVALLVLGPVLSQPLRVSVASLAIAAPLALSVVLLMRQRAALELGLRFVLVGLVLMSSLLMARAVDAWWVPSGYEMPLSPRWMGLLAFLSAFVLLIGGSLGFLLAALERSEQRLRQLADHDLLTGCLNRRAAQAYLAQALPLAQRQGQPLSLVLLDLDHFKRINDQHGHQTGDEVLRATCERLRERLRASDLLVRLGGEEFAVLLPATDAAGAATLAETLRASLADAPLSLPSARALPITASFGTATYTPPGPPDPDALYRQADAALYAAKADGRNAVRSSS